MQSTAFQDLSSHRDLLTAWTMRTIRARYKQSMLGGLWAILQPAAIVIILNIVFTRFVQIDTGGLPYVLVSYSAMVPWVLFTTSVTDMVDSLVVNMNLVSKIYFPREILPIAAMAARLLDFFIASSVLILLIIYYQVPVFAAGLAFLPAILVTQIVLALGLGFAGSALNVFYRDIKHLFVLGLQILFYATPVIYPVSVIPERYRALVFLNPMAGVVEAYRAILLYGEMPSPYLGLSVVISFVILLGGYWFFKKVEFQFADLV